MTVRKRERHEALDVWDEIIFEKRVESDELEEELRYALRLKKAAGTG